MNFNKIYKTDMKIGKKGRLLLKSSEQFCGKIDKSDVSISRKPLLIEGRACKRCENCFTFIMYNRF